MMTVKRKILLVFCIALLLFLTTLAGAILYLYYHPENIKPFIEKSLSASTGTSLTIKTLSYSIRPLTVKANGILLTPGEGQHGFALEIPSLKAEMILEGPFMQRRLVLTSIKIEDFSLNLTRDIDFPTVPPKSEGSTFLRNFFGGILGIFFFRDVTFQSGELVDGHISAQLEDQNIKVRKINLRVISGQPIKISCEMQMDWPSKNLEFTAPYIHMVTDSSISLVSPKISFLLTSQKMTLQGREVSVKRGELNTRFTYDHNKKKINFEHIDLHSEEIRLKQFPEGETTFQNPEVSIKSIDIKSKLTHELNQKVFTFESVILYLRGMTLKQEPQKKPIPFNLRLSTRVSYKLEKNHLTASDFHLTVEDILQLKGRFDAKFSNQATLGLQLQDAHFYPDKIRGFLPLKIQEDLEIFQFGRPIMVHGIINGTRKGQKWLWDCDLGFRLKKNLYAYSSRDIHLNGLISGEIQAGGRFPDLVISAELEGDKTNFKGKGTELKSFKVRLSLSGKVPLFEVKDLIVRIPHAEIGMGKQVFLIDDIRLKARNGRIDGERKTLVLPEIRIDSFWLKNLLFAMEIDEKQFIFQLRGDDLHLIQGANLLQLFPSGWQFSGKDSIRIKAISKKKDVWNLFTELGFKDLAFQNREGSIVGEKISFNARIDGEIDLNRSSVKLDVSMGIRDGELLYDRFYLDLNRNPFFFTEHSTYDIQEKSLDPVRIQLGFEDIMSLEMKGRVLLGEDDHEIHLSLSIPKTYVEPVFQHLLLEPFKTEKPFLDSLKPMGTISAVVDLTSKKGAREVKGHFLWNDGEMLLGDKGFTLKGIQLDLPIWYQTQETGTGKNPLKGKLIVESLIIPFLPEQNLNLPLDAGPNRLSIQSPTSIKLKGGNIRLGPVKARDIFTPSLSMDTSLTLESLEIHPLLSDLWSRPLEGTLKGRLDPIFYKGNSISTRGEIKAEIFGGEILLSDFGATGVLTSAPLLRFNVEWKNLLLAAMTADTSFGKIEGVLRGSINDLEIVYGQPQRFDLLLETVKKEGVPQKISVTAVDNIARIGGGQSPFMGIAGVFTSFFREFSYKKIGLRASLENDVFTINGTIKEGGVEYLIKRGGFSGVNIVNQNLDNRISFKDMVKRIKRITGSKGGPVIK